MMSGNLVGIQFLLNAAFLRFPIFSPHLERETVSSLGVGREGEREEKAQSSGGTVTVEI